MLSPVLIGRMHPGQRFTFIQFQRGVVDHVYGFTGKSQRVDRAVAVAEVAGQIGTVQRELYKGEPSVEELKGLSFSKWIGRISAVVVIAALAVSGAPARQAQAASAIVVNDGG